MGWRGFDIEDDAVRGVDQIIGGVSRESRTASDIRRQLASQRRAGKRLPISKRQIDACFEATRT